MALTITNAGSITSIASAASSSVINVTANVGDMLVVACAASNSGTSGAASITGVTDSGGNTYVVRNALVNNDPGAANAGTTLGPYTTIVTTAMTLGSVTVSFSPNTPQDAIVIQRIQPGAGNQITFVAAGAGATGTGSTPSITASTTTSGDTIFGLVAAEHDSAPTGDADTTNGSWSTIYTAVANGGSGANYQTIGMEWKTMTGSGVQTFNPALGASRDWAINWFTIREEAAPATFTAFRRRYSQQATGVIG